MHSLLDIALLCLLTGLAGFIDSIAGGGGLISLPAYLIVGLPAQLAAGSNNFSAYLGSLSAIIRFAKNGKIQWASALIATVAALLGSAMGTQCALLLSERALHLTFIIALPCVALFLVIVGIPKSDDRPPTPCSSTRTTVASALIGLLLGAYDGLIGPGAGTFMILASIAFLHLDLVTASANAKVINNASGLASTMLFVINGDVDYTLAIPAACSTIVANSLGVKYCLKYGSKGIRKILFVVLFLLLAKLVIDATTH